MENMEQIVLHNLVQNQDYGRKVLPFIKADYFAQTYERALFNIISEYYNKYNEAPTKETVAVEAESLRTLSADESKQIQKCIDSIKVKSSYKFEWLLEHTEKFCKKRAFYNALMLGASMLENDGEGIDEGKFAQAFDEAKAVSFDTRVGLDYLNDADSRFDWYEREIRKIPFDLKYLNEITEGGVEPKTLSIITAPIHGGKSLLMCHLAASFFTDGKKVLYITMEMGDMKIGERIDANLLNITFAQVSKTKRDILKKKLAQIKTVGSLKIKEYPCGSASAAHFELLLKELKVKQNFEPDVILVDYLNICASYRAKGKSVNKYEVLLSVAEELRALATIHNCAVITAAQLIRSAQKSDDVDMTDIGESLGIANTADFMISLTSTDEQKKMNVIQVKQLKNRFGSVDVKNKAWVGVDRQKGKFYDTEDPALPLSGLESNNTSSKFSKLN